MHCVKPTNKLALLFLLTTSTVGAESLDDAVHLPGAERAHVSLSNERAVVQSSSDSNHNTLFTMYKNRDEGWYVDQTVLVNESGLFLGGVIGLDQDTLVAGFMDAPNYFEQNGAVYSDQPSSGAGYIFQADQSGQWENSQFIQVDESWRRMGRTLDISDNTIVLGGAPYYADKADIDIYMLGASSAWQLHASIDIELLNLYRDYLYVGGGIKDFPGVEYIGSILSVDNDTLIFRATPDTAGVELAVFGENRLFDTSTKVYIRDGDTWVFQATLTEGDEFSVDLDEDTALVGQVGAAIFFTRDENGDWSEQDKIISADDSFGYDVSIAGDYAVIASRTALYRFKRNENNQWQQLGPKVTSRDIHAVKLDGENILVSATANNGNQGAFIIPVSTETLMTGACLDTDSDGCGLNSENNTGNNNESITGDDNAGAATQSSGGGIAGFQFLCLLLLTAAYRQTGQSTAVVQNR